MKDKIIEALKRVYDPEIPVNIYEMGLVYNIDILESGNVNIDITLTSPSCPAAQEIPMFIEATVGAIEGVNKVFVNTVWEPMWHQGMMSEAAKLQLNL